MRTRFQTRWRVALVGVLAGLLSMTVPVGAMPGVKTKNPAMVRTIAPGWSVEPLLSSGDMVGGYQMAAIPDGLGAYDNNDGTFTLFMNHELTSKDKSNLSDARVSKLIVEKATMTVLSGEYVVQGTEGYYRFCSATMVGPDEGFPSHYYLTGEEATDSKHGGMAVAIDTKTGKLVDMPWLGKLAHENIIVAPGFRGKTVALTTDDTAPGFVYMFVANSPADLLAGKGQLYVLASDSAKSEGDFSKGQTYTAKWAAIGQDENKDAKALQAAATAKGGIVFARPEDIVYDPTDPTTLYFDTTGRVGFKGPSDKDINGAGRIYRLKLDPSDPTQVQSLQVLLDGNAGDKFASPDNLDTDGTVLMIQEDLTAEFRTRVGRIHSYDLKTGVLTPLAELVQADLQGQPILGSVPGTWETSGIIDMSAILGPNTWLIDVQAELKVAQFGGMDSGGQLLLLRGPVASVQPTPGGGTQPGLPSTGGGGGSDNLPLNWLLVPLALVLAAATVVLRRREAA